MIPPDHDRIALALVDADELRRALSEGEPGSVPAPETVGRIADFLENPVRLDQGHCVDLAAHPVLLLLAHLDLVSGCRSFPHWWSQYLGQAGESLRCALDVTPPTWEEVLGWQRAGQARVMADLLQELGDLASLTELATALDNPGDRQARPFRWTSRRWRNGALCEVTLEAEGGIFVLRCDAALAPTLVTLIDAGVKRQAVPAETSASLVSLGFPADWFTEPNGERFVEFRVALAGFSIEDNIPLGFGPAYLRAWIRDIEFGFWATFASLYRMVGQPGVVFRWLGEELAALTVADVRIGVPPLTGVAELSEELIRRAKPNLDAFRQRHPPLSARTDDELRSVAPEFGDALTALGALNSTQRMALWGASLVVRVPAWHGLLQGLAQRSQPLGRCVDLAMPFVPVSRKNLDSPE